MMGLASRYRRLILGCFVIGSCFIVSNLCASFILQQSQSSFSVGKSNHEGVVILDPLHPCGPTCVALILRLCGKDVPLDEVVNLVQPDSLGRSSMDELVFAANKLSLHAVAVAVPVHDLCKLRTPMILHWKDSHFVVAVAARDGNFLILDPPRDPKTMSVELIRASYSGRAIIVQDSEDALLHCLSEIGLN